ncbi:MAG: hypothetical protein M1828_005820 [Chrysothrix sp. TS-e1954]|nr:MAG: hypothetical protein M1828_005820 [Chrysothrix sp. TS-e1954]
MILFSALLIAFISGEAGLTIASLAGGFEDLAKEDESKHVHQQWIAARILLIFTIVLLFAVVCMYILHIIKATKLLQEGRLETRHAWTSVAPAADEEHSEVIANTWRSSQPKYERARSFSDPTTSDDVDMSTGGAMKSVDDSSFSRHATLSSNPRRQTLLQQYYSINRESLNRESGVYIGGNSHFGSG